MSVINRFIFFILCFTLFPRLLISQEIMEFNVGDIRNWGDKATYGYPRKELKEGTYKFIGFDPTKSVFSTKKVFL